MKNSVPKKIAKYQIIRELGHGSSGVVYLAEDPFSGREIAIKLANRDIFNDPDQGARYRHMWQNEASLVGRLNHPHIVGVYDAFYNDRQAFIVMEYVDGPTLQPYTRADNLRPIREVVEIAFKCCLALEYANTCGLIHRDIKPANILTTKEGEIKLTDFGSALVMQSEITQLIGMVGSPAYMSPEQLGCEPLTLQTDIFSLGVVLYQLLTGHLPFNADNDFSLVYKIIHDDYPPLRTLRREIPAALESIVHRALEKKCSRRYSNWSTFATDLVMTFKYLGKAQGSITETEKFNLLKPLSFFMDFSDVELWEALRISKWIRLPAGRTILAEGKGKRDKYFYILVEGKVQVTKRGRPLSVIRAGSSIGEMAFLNPQEAPRTATVSALTPVTLIRIEPESLANSSASLRARFNGVFIRLLIERLTYADHLLSCG